jgi:lipid A disaccharide synthetase
VAIAETPLVARRHRDFTHIFAVSEDVVERLRARAVPASKVSMSGDPRSDAVAAGTGSSDGRGQVREDSPVVSFLPGSRDRFFSALVPYFVEIAAALAAAGVRTAPQVIVSEFLSPRVVQDAREMVTRRWPHLGIRWITHDPWAVMRGSDLIVTIPGTNTLELAMLAVPFVVVVDEDLLQYAPLEGALEWLARAPVVGTRLRRLMLRQAIRRIRFVALPNARAGRMVVPEWVGRWTREDLAKRVAELLADPARLRAIRTDLQGLGLLRPGASDRIVETALALAGRNVAQR